MKETFETLFAFILSSGAAAIVLFGLSKWLGDVWLKRILQKEKAELDRKTAEFNAERDRLLEKFRHDLTQHHYIFSKQYEKECSVYEDLWVKIVELRSAAENLRPHVDFNKKDQTDEERRKERLECFRKHEKAARKSTQLNKPFYSNKVYDIVIELNILCVEEAFAFNDTLLMQDKEYWKKAEKNSEKITELSDQICDAIRERLNAVQNDLISKEKSNINSNKPTCKTDA